MVQEGTGASSRGQWAARSAQSVPKVLGSNPAISSKRPGLLLQKAGPLRRVGAQGPGFEPGLFPDALNVPSLSAGLEV